MPKFIDRAGLWYGRLVALKPERIEGRWHWLCVCDCGNEKIVAGSSLTTGNTSSCGCVHKEQLQARNRIHGWSGKRTYNAWKDAKARCLRPTHQRRAHYGGRGVKMHPEWANSFEAFLRDMGECPEGLTLDRIDPNKGYEPGNCRWATWNDQARNKRDARQIILDGKRMPLMEACEHYGVKYATARWRHAQGWLPEEIVGLLPRGS